MVPASATAHRGCASRHAGACSRVCGKTSLPHDYALLETISLIHLNLKYFMNLKAFLFVQHVNWCIPTHAVFQNIYLTKVKT